MIDEQRAKILMEANEAVLATERCRSAIEIAREAVERARALVEEARAEEAAANVFLDSVLARADEAGMPRAAVRNAAEQYVRILVQSGLVDLAPSGEGESSSRPSVRVKGGKGQRGRTKADAAADAPGKDGTVEASPADGHSVDEASATVAGADPVAILPDAADGVGTGIRDPEDTDVGASATVSTATDHVAIVGTEDTSGHFPTNAESEASEDSHPDVHAISPAPAVVVPHVGLPTPRPGSAPAIDAGSPLRETAPVDPQASAPVADAAPVPSPVHSTDQAPATDPTPDAPVSPSPVARPARPPRPSWFGGPGIPGAGVRPQAPQ